MIGWLVFTLMTIGAAFMFLAAVGLARLPDIYMRLSACTKAATLGAALLLVGTAIHFQDVGVASRAIAISLFLLVTGPVASHMIGRAAYLSNTPLWDNTLVDELRDCYDLDNETLHSTPPHKSDLDGTQDRGTGPDQHGGTGNG